MADIAIAANAVGMARKRLLVARISVRVRLGFCRHPSLGNPAIRVIGRTVDVALRLVERTLSRSLMKATVDLVNEVTIRYVVHP